jgi:hypothetical protein
MTQESQKSNTVLIIIAIIGVVGTIVAATIGAIGNYNTEKLRQEAELTRIALASNSIQNGITQVPMTSAASTPIPINVLAETSTATYVNTATSTPTINLQAPMNKYLSNITVTSADWFDALSKENWSCNLANNTDGMLLINSGSSCTRINVFHTGQGVLTSFKLDKDSGFTFWFSDRLGQWDTDSYKRFGFATSSNNGAEASIFDGKNWVGKKLQSQKPETWYNLLLAIGNKSNFLLIVWERDNPTNEIVYSRQITNWNDIDWELIFDSHYGTVRFDDYMEISFSEIK